MLNDMFLKRFEELPKESDSLPFEQDGELRYVRSGSLEKWATSCQNLIKAVFGEESPHYINFTSRLDKYSGYESEVHTLQGVFRSAKEDFEGGYVFNVDLRISGEVFGDFVVLAQQSLAEGYKDVAAVLASAALEDALKRYAKAEGLNIDNQSMPEVINALKAKGLVSGPQKSLLNAMPRIRNSAMHADWGKISELEVSSIIGFVERLLLTKFDQG